MAFDSKLRLEPGGPGWVDLRKRFNAYMAESDRWLARRALQGMRGIEAQAKALCPKDTGALRDSIHVKAVPGGRAGYASGGFSCVAGGKAAREADAAAYNKRQSALGYREHRRAATFRVSGGRVGRSSNANRAYKVIWGELVTGESAVAGDLEVGTDLYYAYFVEFGTKYMMARPFMRPAWDREYRRVIQIIAATEFVDYRRSQVHDKDQLLSRWAPRRETPLVTSSAVGSYQVNSNTYGTFNISG